MPDSITKLIAVRHGETEWNVQARDQGQLDSSLTPTGIAQAHALAQRLRHCEFQHFYSSDLGRAVQTAQIIAAATGIAFKLDAGLRERHSGVFQGLTRAEMAAKLPAQFAEYERLGHRYEIPDGESGLQRTERSVRVLTALAARHPGETVLAVTHGAFLLGFFEHVLGIEPGNPWRFRRLNAAFNSFEYAGGRWTLETWNDVSHLRSLGARDDPAAVAK
jgi:broad specificity phosphatase PhoE